MEKNMTQKEAKKIFEDNNHRIIDKSVDGFVSLKHVDKVYNNKVQAVFDFNLSVEKNEFIVLVGPSGCGKSTTLRMIAGLEEITNGYLYIDNVLSNYLESKDRDIAMVFQSYALYPNLNVFENIAFGLRARRVPNDIVKQKVYEAADILDLGPYLDRKPKELSGGQQQRVALGRAIVRNAKLFLMDEPLSNLDAKLRVQMRSEIVRLHRNINATTIYVTHDQTEAMTMADRIVIMNKGIIQQIGKPIDIYNNPSNVFVASFIGNPPMNIVRVPIKDNKIDINGQELSLKADVLKKYSSHIIERRELFNNLKQKVDFTSERELANKIEVINKYINSSKYNENDVREVFNSYKTICEFKTLINYNKKLSEFNEFENRQVVFNRLEEIKKEVSKYDTSKLIERIKEKIKLFKKKNIDVIRVLTTSIKQDLTEFSTIIDFYNLDKELFTQLDEEVKLNNFEALKAIFNRVISELEKIDLRIAGELKKFKSGLVSTNKDKNLSLEDKKKGHKKDKQGHTLYDDNIVLIEEFLSEYNKDESLFTPFIGIRPEDIHLKDDQISNLSNALAMKAEFVELLGSEYCVYLNVNEQKVIMKCGLAHRVNNNELIDIVFDLDKLRVFDPISGERVI